MCEGTFFGAFSNIFRLQGVIRALVLLSLHPLLHASILCDQREQFAQRLGARFGSCTSPSASLLATITLTISSLLYSLLSLNTLTLILIFS